jgi:predicted dehydrogenase
MSKPASANHSSTPAEVRIGIVGLGNMGATHARTLLAGQVPRLRLTALCDADPARLTTLPAPAHFTDPLKLIHSGEVDAVIVATPHYSHTTIGIATLKAGLHLMVEKPISVHKSDCERLIAAHRGQVFAAMFNQRTDPYYQKLRALIHSGEFGEIRRINWTITNWFRTEAYYASGGWRATWAGEGGGVLLNQCPHNLDLLQWMFGMPVTVRAFCGLGRYHKIEVEDDVTAYMQFKNGATGLFIASTGEAPGTNRLEIAAEMGRIVYESDRITFTRNETAMTKFSRQSESGFAAPQTWDINIPISGHGEQHLGILKNFAAAILDGAPLIAPAADGIHSVELANAMIFSSFTGKTVDLPLNGKTYEAFLKKRIATSKVKKKAPPRRASIEDFAKSFK